MEISAQQQQAGNEHGVEQHEVSMRLMRQTRQLSHLSNDRRRGRIEPEMVEIRAAVDGQALIGGP